MNGKNLVGSAGLLDRLSADEKTESADSFERVLADEIMERLEVGRRQNEAGEGIPFCEAMKRIADENGFRRADAGQI